MKQKSKQTVLAGFLYLSLLLLLSGCISNSTTNGGDPTPTTGVTTPTQTATLNISLTRTYTKDGYTIEYPLTWRVRSWPGQAPYTSEGSFYDPVVVVAGLNIGSGPDKGQTVDSLLNAALASTNSSTYHQGGTTTATLGGANWKQISWTEDSIGSPASTGATLATTYKGNLYLLSYSAPSTVYDTYYTVAFKPMLQTFKFTD